MSFESPQCAAAFTEKYLHIDASRNNLKRIDRSFEGCEIQTISCRSRLVLLLDND